MFLVDLEAGQNHRRRRAQASGRLGQKPYGEWLKQNMVSLADLPPAPEVPETDHDTLLNRQIAFGYTVEDLKYIVGPMGESGEEAIGSMGTDTPLAVLSEKAQPLFNYFKQLFAQVTNPPLDAIREELVTSVFTGAGAEGNLLEPGPENCRQIALEMPILDNHELARLEQLKNWRGFTTRSLKMLFPVAEGAPGMASALQSLIEEACAAIEQGASLIVLSDRGVTAGMAPIPSLLACSGLHHEMVRRGLRARAGLVIECGDAREVHHFALLLGLWRRNDQSLPRVRDARRHDPAGMDQGNRSRPGRLPLPQGDQERGREGDVQDGHQHDPLLSRGPDVRGRRLERRFRQALLR